MNDEVAAFLKNNITNGTFQATLGSGFENDSNYILLLAKARWPVLDLTTVIVHEVSAARLTAYGDYNFVPELYHMNDPQPAIDDPTVTVNYSTEYIQMEKIDQYFMGYSERANTLFVGDIIE